MTVYDLVQSYMDNRSLCLKIGPIPNKLLYFVHVLIADIIYCLDVWNDCWDARVLNPAVTEVLKSQLVTSPATSRKTGPRCCMTCHHDALKHFKRLFLAGQSTDLG